MNLKTAYNSGVKAALARFKVAGPMGAAYGVAPPGNELSHGTQLNTYPPRRAGEPDQAAEAKALGATDFLWNISDIDHMAPGGAGGQYGQETIG